jgi:hypothetical protein
LKKFSETNWIFPFNARIFLFIPKAKAVPLHAMEVLRGREAIAVTDS